MIIWKQTGTGNTYCYDNFRNPDSKVVITVRIGVYRIMSVAVPELPELFIVICIVLVENDGTIQKISRNTSDFGQKKDHNR